MLEAYTRTERVSGPNLAVARPGILLLSLLIALFFATKCFAQPAATVETWQRPACLYNRSSGSQRARLPKAGMTS